jgi:hypothetical protein
MEYSTYWSILDTPSKSIQSNSICLFIAIGAGLLWFLIKQFKKENGDGEKKIILWATGLFAILGIAGYVSLTFFHLDNGNEQTLDMLNSNKTPSVEGVITNFERTFRSAKYGGETIEKFIVDSVEFAYGDAALGKFNSFSQTKNNVIFNGQKVRITYQNGSNYGENYKSILKLEIAK